MSSILVLVQSGAPGSHNRFHAAIAQEASLQAITVHLQLVPPAEQHRILDPGFQHPALASGSISGIIFIHRWDPSVVAALCQQWPAVSIVHQYPDTTIDTVTMDERGGIRTLVQHLHATGHPRIGFYGLCREMSWSCSRLAAYAESLHSLHLPYNPAHIVDITLPEILAPGAYPITDPRPLQLFHEHNVNAWLCPSVATSQALCAHFLENGLRLPHDVALAGFHINILSSPGLPQITGTGLNSENELGATALRRLLRRIRNRLEPSRIITIPSVLVQGQTTAPPPEA